MATPLIDLQEFTFGVEQIQAISELVVEKSLYAPEFESVHTIFSGIVQDKEIGFVIGSTLVGKANNGCEIVPQDWTVNTRKLTWEPKDWEILIHACYLELKNTMAAYKTRNKLKYSDFTDSDYMNVVVEVLTEAVREFMWRLVWFNDTAITEEGLQAGVDTGYFNLLDGFWKQIAGQTTVNPKQVVSVDENNGLNNSTMSNANILAYLSRITITENIALREKSNLVILCTQSFYDAYVSRLQNYSALETTYTNTIEGVKRVAYNGIPLIPIPYWDKAIRSYLVNDGKKFNKPHRAVLTSKDVLGVGVNNESAFENLDIWYDKDSRKVKIEGMGIADAKLMNPEMFVVAW